MGICTDVSLSRLSGGEGGLGLWIPTPRSLSRLSGGEGSPSDRPIVIISLSRLSGGEVDQTLRHLDEGSLSRLSGGEGWHVVPQSERCSLSRLSGGEGPRRHGCFELLSLSRLSGGEGMALLCEGWRYSLSRLSGGEEETQQCRSMSKSLSRLSGGEVVTHSRRQVDLDSLSRLSGGEVTDYVGLALPRISQPPIRRGRSSACDPSDAVLSAAYPAGRARTSLAGDYRVSLSRLSGGEVTVTAIGRAQSRLSQPPIRRGSASQRLASTGGISQPPIRRGRAAACCHRGQDRSLSRLSGGEVSLFFSKEKGHQQPKCRSSRLTIFSKSMSRLLFSLRLFEGFKKILRLSRVNPVKFV